MITIPVVVQSKAIEAEGIVSFTLLAQNGLDLPAFEAGSHIDVHVGQGLIRQYSLCNAPSERHRYVISVSLDPQSRGGSSAMHEQISAGDVLQISAPRNHFPLIHAERYLLLAGGIGITPILCMAEHLSAANADFEMHYCARSPERTAFRSRIADSTFRDQVHFHYDSGAADQKLDFGDLFSKQSRGTHVFLCGPTGFIEHATNTARAYGWSDDAIHFEYFSAAPVDGSGDTSFEVRLASSGDTYVIPPDQTVVAVLAQHGIEIPVSCEAGVCGTCLTRVLDGHPDHRDAFMTDEEHAQNDQFTPCCSRSKGDVLVLDL